MNDAIDVLLGGVSFVYQFYFPVLNSLLFDGTWEVLYVKRYLVLTLPFISLSKINIRQVPASDLFV